MTQLQKIRTLLENYPPERTSLLDMLWKIQDYFHFIPEEAVVYLAQFLQTSPVDIRDTISFYHFFHLEPSGKYHVYLNQGIVAEMSGFEAVLKAFQEETGLSWGQTDAEQCISLYPTSCIGMCDQEPACLINDTIFTKLTPEKVKELISQMRQNVAPKEMLKTLEPRINTNAWVVTEVENFIRKKGPVVLQEYEAGASLLCLQGKSPNEVLLEIKNSGLRGRGGAGFPTGLKWELCAKVPAEKRYLLCNADEGEPGTFKDRVLLAEYAGLLFEGMIIAGYALQAAEGIIYLRAEYRYLKPHLEQVLHEFQQKGFFQVSGSVPFSFSIRIQVGAGAYVCGEETALIESLEGKRGEPRYRPPFPTQKGFLGYPTIVNNVETFCTVARILQKGATWFKSFGTEKSAGTRILSVSGDCEYPGVYEAVWGLSLGEFLEMVGAQDCLAVQVGGPSGVLLPATELSRKICFEDLPTGGAMIVFSKKRNILSIVNNFMNFFVEESCGACLPCRAGNVILRDLFQKIVEGRGRPSDLKKLTDWGKMVKSTSRCGLGQTSPNPIMYSLQYFRERYETQITNHDELFYDFDLEKAVQEFDQIMQTSSESFSEVNP